MILLAAGWTAGAEPAAGVSPPALDWNQERGEYVLRLQPGWNLVSLPVQPLMAPLPAASTPATDAELSPWNYDRRGGLYRPVSLLEPLAGYWLFSVSARHWRVPATLTENTTVSLPPGWSLVGPATPMLLAPAESVLAPCWSWDATRRQYHDADGLLQPGHGYWLYCLAPATLALGDPRQDTDGDLLLDVWEDSHGADLTKRDTDDDTLDDFVEVLVHHTRPDLADTDGDGLPDAWELTRGLNPLDAEDALQDTDGDGLGALAEYHADLDPGRRDADLGETPRVRFAQAASRVSETAGEIRVSIILLGELPAAQQVTATVDLLPGLTTAAAGADFTAALPVEVALDAAHRVAHVAVTVLPDDAREADERVTLTLTNVLGAVPGTVTTHGLTIADTADAAADSDHDGLPDAWERCYFGNLTQGPRDNPDGDDLDNGDEYLQGRHPAAGAVSVPPAAIGFAVDVLQH